MGNPSQPILNVPHVVTLLLLINLIIQVLKSVVPIQIKFWLLSNFAFVASPYTDPGAWYASPVYLAVAPFTYMFLHGQFFHFAVNMAMFLAFGTVIARRMNGCRFLIFYMICGFFSAMTWGLLHSTSSSTLIGASGAISGMLGAVAHLALHPARPDTQPFKYFTKRTAVWFTIIWIVFNFIFGALGWMIFDGTVRIAWEAHLGGFATGYFLIGLFDGKQSSQKVA